MWLTPLDELLEVEGTLPETWCPEVPLVERVARLVEVRSKFLDLLELHVVRADTAERQRTVMRRRYLGLLTYARRVIGLERAVHALLVAAERRPIMARDVKLVAEARARLGDPYSTGSLDEAVKVLEPFLRGKHSRVMLTGDHLDAFRTLLRWHTG